MNKVIFILTMTCFFLFNLYTIVDAFERKKIFLFSCICFTRILSVFWSGQNFRFVDTFYSKVLTQKIINFYSTPHIFFD